MNRYIRKPLRQRRIHGQRLERAIGCNPRIDWTINGQALNKRDGLGVWNVDSLNIKADSDAVELLLMDVPMQ